jgi:hypothetical protein
MSPEEILENLVFALQAGTVTNETEAFKRIPGLEKWMRLRLEQKGIMYIRPRRESPGMVSQSVIEILRKNGPAYA